MSIGLWAKVAVFTHAMVILNCLGQVLYLGRAPRTKETLSDFPEWCRVTRHPRLFRGLTGRQRTPGFGASQELLESHGNAVEDEHHVSSTYKRPVGEGHTSVRGHAASIRPELQG